MCFFPIRFKTGNADVSKRMLKRVHKHLVRNSGNICPRHGTLCHMLRLADRGSNDFRFDLVETEYIGNRPDQFYAVLADIIDTSHKGTDIRRPCTGCQQCLPCREN